jgi:hypothetical protein
MEPGTVSAWKTHDWKVKTIESISPGGGSKLAFTCRDCGRSFNQTTLNYRTWAVDAAGVALADEVTDRWLAEKCVRHPAKTDDADRGRLKYSRAS